jgi:23S rRNA (adenine-N6)-dimethyltransferase
VRVDPDGLCLEVGAGEGILTERLAGMCRELVAYELDENVAGRLTARLAGRGNVRVVIGDFLAARPPRTPFQVVGNAPFSVTSPIVDWCLDASTLTSATLITQLEYARKRTGGYGRWSLLTVSTWPRVRWELRGTIPRTQFRPVPRVDAGILHLARRPEPLIPAHRLGAYQRAVQAGFSGVGGTLLASLRREFPADRLGAAFRAAGIDRGAVVAFVSPAQWVELFRFLDRGA